MTRPNRRKPRPVPTETMEALRSRADAYQSIFENSSLGIFQ